MTYSNFHSPLLLLFFCSLGLLGHAQDFLPSLSTYPDDVTSSCADILPPPAGITGSGDQVCPVLSVTHTDVELGIEYEVYSVNDASIGGQGEVQSGFQTFFVGENDALYYWNTEESRLFVSDERAFVVGEVVFGFSPEERFEVYMELINGTDYPGWSGQLTTSGTTSRQYRDLDGLADSIGSPWQDWQYFEVDAVSSYYSGRDVLVGSGGEIFHSPGNYLFGFQIGQAANGYNINEGFSTFAFLDGLIDGEQVSGQGIISGDIDLLGTVGELYCREPVLRTYTVTDVCGKRNSSTQVIYSEGGSFASDLNADGSIDIIDFIVLNSVFGQACDQCIQDLNGDGVVDVLDFLIFNSAFAGGQ